MITFPIKRYVLAIKEDPSRLLGAPHIYTKSGATSACNHHNRRREGYRERYKRIGGKMPDQLREGLDYVIREVEVTLV